MRELLVEFADERLPSFDILGGARLAGLAQIGERLVFAREKPARGIVRAYHRLLACHRLPPGLRMDHRRGA